MSMHCDWLVLCQQVLVDTHTSNLTIVNCLDQVSALAFPVEHPGFAFAARFRWEGEPHDEPRDVEFRLVRFSDEDDEEIVLSLSGVWEPNTKRTRVYSNFHFLRLRRPERLWFRVDSRLRGRRWRKGPAVPVDVLQAQLTQAQREALDAEIGRLGLAREDAGEGG